MQIVYGSYSHSDNECSVAIDREPQFSPDGIRTGYKETWAISGKLYAASVSALTSALAALKAAYDVDGQDVALYDSSGNLTHHQMLSSQTLGGTRVVKTPSFPVGDSAEYTTWRSYTIVLEGEFGVTSINFPGGLLSFHETISFTGSGGAKFVIVTPRNGPPVRMQTSMGSPAVANQSGEAIGYTGYPSPPGPFWPDKEHVEARQINLDSPSRAGGQAGSEREYRISWSYVFEDVTGFNFQPPNTWAQ